MKDYLKWGLLLVLPAYLLDQLTKWVIRQQLDIGEGFVVIPKLFEIIHVRNTGAAFGILRNLPENVRVGFFLVITVVACVGMLVLFKQNGDDSWFIKAILSLVFAGAAGNLTDRLVFKEVVDFLQVYIGTYPWPTFNVADMYISGGMVGLIIYTLFFPDGKKLNA